MTKNKQFLIIKEEFDNNMRDDQDIQNDEDLIAIQKGMMQTPKKSSTESLGIKA
jgi:hypothetical protein